MTMQKTALQIKSDIAAHLSAHRRTLLSRWHDSLKDDPAVTAVFAPQQIDSLLSDLFDLLLTGLDGKIDRTAWLRPFAERIEVISAASVVAAHRIVQRGRQSLLRGLRAVMKDGEFADALLHLNDLFDEFNLLQLIQFLNLPGGWLQEESESRLQEFARLRARLNLFYNAFQYSTDGIIITDLEGRILEVNDAFLRIFGYSYDEVIGRRTGFLRAPQTSDEFYAEMWRSINTTGEWKGEILNRCKDGTLIPIWLSITPVYEDGRRIGYMAVEIDISEKKRIENALIKEKRFTESLIETANSLIVGLDLEGRITLFNKKLETVTGYKKEEVMGRNWFHLFLPESEREAVTHVFEKLVRGGEPSTFENSILTRSGEERFIAWSNTVIRNENNEVIGALGIGQDITEQKRMEQQVLHSERLATIGKMAAKVAHEIRNPLSSIMLNAELLEDEIRAACDELGEDAEVLLKSIMSEVDRVAKLTEDYLQFSRLPDADPQAGDLVQLIQEVIEFIEPEASSRGIQIVADYQLRDSRLVFDALQMRQVLVNIFKNAIEAMRHGGLLSVTVASNGQEVEIAVKDTGEGIPQEVQDKIFQPFYTTKEMGTGLGLAISQQVIHEHGGRITFESVPGKGTTFTIYLPKKRKKKEQKEADLERHGEYSKSE